MTPSTPLPSRWAEGALRIGFSLAGRLPRRISRSTTTVIGRLWYALDFHHRRVTVANIEKALGDELSEPGRRALARKVFENLVSMVFEIGRVSRMGPEDIGRHIRVEGMERMMAAIAQGKGVIAITGHTGNWELLSTLAAHLPTPSNIVYRPLDFNPLDRFFVDFRTRFGGKLIAKSESLKRLFACLRQKEIIALVMDQNVGWRKGVFVDFFGDVACTTKGPAFLALVTGAPVIPLFIRRSEDGFVIDIKEAIDTVDTGNRERDIETNTRRFNQAIEDFIRSYPDQWLWLHRRWKSRPKTDS